MSNDGFNSVQDAVAWANKRAPEDLYIMKKKDGTPGFYLIGRGYEDHYNKFFDLVAKIEVKREVVYNVPPPPPPPVAHASTTAKHEPLRSKYGTIEDAIRCHDTLVEYFRSKDGDGQGHIGDINNWPPERTAISFLRRADYRELPTPQINIVCETQENGITGTTSLNVIRVEREDDGSLTAVTDEWPQAPRQVYNGAYKAMEEIGEFLQILGKLGPFPHGNHPDGGPNLRERLKEELADVRAATAYLAEFNFNLGERDDMADRTIQKRRKYEKWGLTGFDANVDQS